MINGNIRMVPAQIHTLRILEFEFLGCDILWEIDQDRPRSPGGCDVKRLLYDPRKVVYIFYQIIVFCDRKRDSGDVSLLKGVVSDHRCRNLSCYRDDRNRVHVGVCDAGNEISCARSGCCEAYPDLSGCSCVSVCRMCGTLLMPYQNVPDVRIIQFVVQR